MKIKNIIHQHRRDFSALMYCESCGHEQILNSGYDDRYYHDQVIPSMTCDECGESTSSLGYKVEQIPTKYPEGYHI